MQSKQTHCTSKTHSEGIKIEAKMEDMRLLQKDCEDQIDDGDQKEDNTEKRSRTKILIGIISAFSYVFSIVVSSICVSRLNRSMGDFELSTLRNGFGLIVYACAIAYQKKIPIIPRCHFGKVIINCIVSNNSLGIYIAVTSGTSLFCTMHCNNFWDHIWNHSV